MGLLLWNGVFTLDSFYQCVFYDIGMFVGNKFKICTVCNPNFCQKSKFGFYGK